MMMLRGGVLSGGVDRAQQQVRVRIRVRVRVPNPNPNPNPNPWIARNSKFRIDSLRASFQNFESHKVMASYGLKAVHVRLMHGF